MKGSLFLIVLFFLSATTFSQVDNVGGSIAAPIIGESLPPIENPITPKKSSFFSNNILPSTNSKEIELPSKLNFNKRSQFVNPGAIVEKKLNPTPQKEGTQIFRRNQYLGDVRTKGRFVNVLCRDHEYVDGDQIKIYVNDVLINERMTLIETFQEVQIELKQGFNKIEFEAINQGSSGPNTAEFRVYDDDESIISANQWNLATGFRATIIVVKE